MSDHSWQDPDKGPATGEVAFDYVKGPDFRAVWADGIIGSNTPSGNVHFCFFAERQAIPRRQVFAIDAESGQLGKEVVEKQISRGSIVREMSFDVLMTSQSARSFAKWLVERADELDSQQASGEKK